MTLTVICEVRFPEASKVADDGEKLQPTPFTPRPFTVAEQNRLIVSLNPFTDATFRLKVADWPTLNVALDGVMVGVPKSPTCKAALVLCVVKPVPPLMTNG